MGKVETIEYSHTVIKGQHIRTSLGTNTTYIQRWNKSDFCTMSYQIAIRRI